MPRLRAAPTGLLVAGLLSLALLPGASGQIYEDPIGDAGAGMDVERIHLVFGNGTLGVQIQFDPGELRGDRAVRGVVVAGTPGQPEPAEWYQFTIANETTVYVAHAGAPHLAELVATSWTGDLAIAEWRREAPSANPCGFAVVEAGTMDASGFVRTDVAPPGFASPEEAWPVDECPGELIIEGCGFNDSCKRDEKGSPGLPSLVVLAGLLAVALVRRRA